MSVWRVFKYRAGGEGEEVCPNERAIERFRSRIKEMNHAKSRKKRYQRGILAYVVMADGFVRWGLLKKIFYLFFVSFLSIPRNAFFVPREAFVVLEFVFA